jgi:hypothetical protein
MGTPSEIFYPSAIAINNAGPPLRLNLMRRKDYRLLRFIKLVMLIL